MSFPPPIETLMISAKRITATSWASDNSTIYAQCIDSNGAYCSCPRSLYNGELCKHLQLVAGLVYDDCGIDVDNFICQQILKEREDMTRMIETSLQAYNKLMGGLAIGLVTGFYGAHEVGKTTLELLFSCDTMRYYQRLATKDKEALKKANVLWFATEPGFADGVLLGQDVNGKTWLEKMSDRFGIELGIEEYRIDMEKWLQEPGKFLPLKLRQSVNDSAPSKFIVIDVGRLQQCMLAHGRDITIDYGKTKAAKKKRKGAKDDEEDDKDTSFDTEGRGKVTVKPNPSWKNFQEIWQVPVAQWIRDYNIGCLVYDSITALTAGEFSNDNPSFPGRSSVNMMLYEQINALLDYYDLVGMTSHHLTKDEATFMKGVPTGGKAVGHNQKYWVYVKKGTRGNLSDDEKSRVSSEDLLRVLECTRHPNRPPGGTVQIKMTNNGLVDV